MKKTLSSILILFCLNLIVANSELHNSKGMDWLEQKTVTKSKLYPNPAKDFVFIKNYSSSKLKNISILSMVGSSVFSKEITDNNNNPEINVSKLPTGKYFVKVSYLDGYMEILTLIKI